jgi:flagellar hook-associated protein 2
MASISALGVGSGLDLTGLLDQLESAERKRLEPLAMQRKGHQAKISAFGRLESALTEFQKAAAKLNSAKAFTTMKSSVSGDAATAATGGDAMAGTYQISITDKARSYSIATQGIADSSAALGAGTISISLASGETLDVDIPAGDSSLEAVRDAINAADGGVAASIVNDGGAEPYRLVLASSDTGTEAAISAVDFGALGGSLALDAGTEITAANAQLTVNGIAIQSQSNTVEGAIQGVTLELADTGDVTLEVQQDKGAIKTAIENFVTSYNSLQKTIDGLTGYDQESGTAGTLLGNSTLRSVDSRLRVALGTAEEGGELGILSDLGIARQLNGTLVMDEATIDELLANSSDELAAFFAGDSEEGGFAGRMNSVLETMVEDKGLIDNATSGLTTSMESLERRYERAEQGIASTIERYRKQFGQLDAMVANMNSVSSYLTQQFDMMNAQLGRKN